MKSETITTKQLYAKQNTVSNKNNFRVYNDPPAVTIPLKNKVVLTDEAGKTPTKALNRLSLAVLVSTFILMLGSAYLVYYLQAEFYDFNTSRINSAWGFAFLIVTSALLLFKIGFFIYNVVLYLKYKPIESVTNDLLPTVTVIVPAYNEGKLVLDTLMSLAASDYPQHKLQLLAVDDGSKDDTWSYMQLAKQKLGERLAIYQHPQNKGTRHALYLGFNLGTGDVFVTVDSDSIVKTDTLRLLVSPLVTNTNCGAVAGNVQVLNKNKGILPKMLNVSFVMSFEFMRSVESA
jgi:hyaluronan synthase